MPGRDRTAPGSGAAVAEWAWIAAIFLLYLTSFGPGSPVHGPDEIFDQDSVHLVGALADGVRYPWNPQHHLLFHTAAAAADALLPGSRRDPPAAIGLLRWLPALAGLAWLLALRVLLVRAGLGPWRRLVLLTLGGCSMAAWGGFALIETYALAMPFFMLYLVAMHARLAPAAGGGGRILLVAALAGCAWARIELAGLVALTALLLAHPRLRGRRRALAADLAAAALVVVAGLTGLAMLYLDASPRKALRKLAARGDRASLAAAVGRPENLAPGHVLRVGRAAAVYAFLMPAGGAAREADVAGESRVRYFAEPLRNFLGRPWRLAALGAVLVALATAAVGMLRRAAAGDPFAALLAVLWAAGLLFYTWFNPHEPYLWIQPFAALTVAGLARSAAALPRRAWAGLAGIAVLVAVHNAIWFREAFRA